MKLNRKRKLQAPSLLVLLLVGLVFVGCRDKTQIIPDNDAPYYGEIATLQIESYVNKMYIDLIGREPLPEERNENVSFLRANDLSMEARSALVENLQSDTTWRDGDTSYTYAYYRQFYEFGKARLLEGAEDGDIQQKIGILANGAYLDFLDGDSVGMQIKLAKMELYVDVVKSRIEFRDGLITVNEMFYRMLRCPIYDNINMNTFNLVNAAFNDLYFRYPTQPEFDAAYDMIEYNQSAVLFLQSGATYEDFCRIVSNSREFHEGLIRWAFLTLLAREPGTNEMAVFLNDFIVDKEFPKIQRALMITDEYANF